MWTPTSSRAAWTTLAKATDETIYDAIGGLFDLEPSKVALYQSDKGREFYHRFEIPKRRGGQFRVLHAPAHEILSLQRGLAEMLSAFAQPHPRAMAFRRINSRDAGEALNNVVAHARLHQGKRLVYALDLKDFFPSITWPRIYGMFLKATPFRASQATARVLANLVTVSFSLGEAGKPIRRLPQGAPTSPLLSNLVCFRLDHILNQWARRRGFVYSRYADDLAFSTDHGSFPSALQEELHEFIAEEGFEVHPEKTRLMPYHQRQVVTGLVVNERANLPRAYLRAMRALLFNVRHFGWASQINRPRLFSSFEEYDAYRYKELAPETHHELRKKQHAERALVNTFRPPLRIPRGVGYTAAKVRWLRRYVWGHLSWIKQVRGATDSVYLDLLEHYEAALAGWPLPTEVGVKGEAPKQVIQKRQTHSPCRGATTLGYQNARQCRERSSFINKASEYARRLNRAGANEQAAIRNELLPFLEQSVRMGRTRVPWPEARDLRGMAERLPESPGDLQELVKQLPRKARRVGLPPTVVASFFKAFHDNSLYKNLLHSEDPDLDVRSALSRAQEHYERYRPHLPHALIHIVNALMDAVHNALEADQSLHPYNHPKFKGVIQGCKRALRIDFVSEVPSSEEALHLPFELDRWCEEASIKNGGDYEGLVLHRQPVRIYSLNTELGNGLRWLIESAFEADGDQRGEGVRCEIDSSKARAFNGQHIDIRVVHQNSQVDFDAGVEDFFVGAKLSRAARHFRGLADWHITGSFSNGKHRVNMLSGDVEPYDEPGSEDLTHHIRLYNIRG